ncbi:MAG TPA: NepR family anti-sigma factor [Alphaproteobacteria bacterium]|nr:NepR family anti-sigma factor [Alphaproteobacteria bacterium]
MELPTRARRNLASRSPTKPSAQAPCIGADPPASFDDWLDGRLKNLYQAVLNEPLPEEIMKLLAGQKKSDGSK